MNFAWKFVVALHVAQSACHRALAFHGRGLAALGGFDAILAAAYVLMGRLGLRRKPHRPQEISLC